MLSKLTFSLASLIVLLMIGFCLPVAAQVVGLGTDPVEIEAMGFAVYARSVPGTEEAESGLPDNSQTNTTALADLPDLEEFFRFGGTLALLGPSGKIITREADADGTPPVTEQSVTLSLKDIVISEIMWALDVDNPATADENNDRRQWIEIYNTMSDEDGRPMATPVRDADNTDDELLLKFMFIPYKHVAILDIPNEDNFPADHIVLDAFSNLQFVRWSVPGQNGNTTLPGANPLDPPLKPLHSAYRNIDYAKVQGIHKLKADNTVDNTIVAPATVGLNRGEQLAGVPDGYVPGSWLATPALGRRNTELVSGADLIIATPLVQHVKDVVYTGVTMTALPAVTTVVINEVRDDATTANVDWVELYNAGTEAVGLWDWELTKITGTDAAKTDTVLVGYDVNHPPWNRDQTSFPRDENFKLQPGDYLLIVNRHPSKSPIADGVDIDGVIAGTNVNAGATHQYIVRSMLDFKSGDMLILRNNFEKNAQHTYPRKPENAQARATTDIVSSEAIVDYVGKASIAVKTNEYNTLVWPFRGWTIPAKDRAGIGGAIARKVGTTGGHKDNWEVGGNAGMGYDPGVNRDLNPGSPGYPNKGVRDRLVDDKNTVVTTDDVIYNGMISISEVMYDAGPRWNLIQWIELYNSSMTEAVNIAGWEMEIFNATDEVESYVDSGFVFNDAIILPNQTLLIVSGTGTNDVSSNRVYNLYQHHRRDLGLTNRRSVLLSPSGFYLSLIDKNLDDVDEAGNVMIDGAERNVMWELPPRNPDVRQSLVRQYGSRELYDGTPDSADDGTMMESWRKSDLAGAGISFYGHRDDVSTPGYRLGGPLPVQLSKFRPVRNQETGHVDIQWITESELNNAGFNILRKEGKTGEFKVINVKGIIAGHGTTSEQHVYKYTDTTAKPNVVYYYQIEDVSINGLRTTLTTTHLRGDVSAAGKVTTTWGDLKLQK